MKSRLFLFLPISFACMLLAQSTNAQDTKDNANALQGIKRSFAIKLGASYQHMTSFKSFSIGDNFGFFAGVYFQPPTASRFSFRSELILSRQGYDYSSSHQTGNVMLTYLMLPQLATFRINKFLELHAGGQVALLLGANVDSSVNPSSVPSLEKASSYFNRFNYGAALGFDVSPSKGSFIGARYNLFFDTFKGKTGATVPGYVPDYSGNVKNGLLQLYVGFRF
jgi:hypothetical protein